MQCSSYSGPLPPAFPAPPSPQPLLPLGFGLYHKPLLYIYRKVKLPHFGLTCMFCIFLLTAFFPLNICSLKLLHLPSSSCCRAENAGQYISHNNCTKLEVPVVSVTLTHASLVILSIAKVNFAVHDFLLTNLTILPSIIILYFE